MKAFRFALDRVLKLREAELNTEQGKLEAISLEHGRMQKAREQLDVSLQQAVISVRSQTYVHPSELVSLERYNTAVDRDRKEWDARISQHLHLVEQQKKRVTEAKMRVRMLEKLREKRQAEWQAEADRELDQLTDDFTAAQWLRLEKAELRLQKP